VAISDAWTLGTNRAFKIRCLIDPRRLFSYLSNGINYVYANSSYSLLSRAISLPKPIFRYWSLFPKNFLEKYQRHMELFKLHKFQKSFEILRSHVNNPEILWKLGSEALKQSGFKEMPNYPEAFSFVEKKDHPAIIQEFISNPHTDQYYVREELFELLRKL
jgi:hypothetical protein